MHLPKEMMEIRGNNISQQKMPAFFSGIKIDYRNFLLCVHWRRKN